MQTVNNEIRAVSAKETFLVKANGQEFELAVMRPTYKHNIEAQKIYNKAFKDAVESGALFRQKLNKLMIEQGLWGPEKSQELEELQNTLADKTVRLEDESLSKENGDKISTEMRELRVRLMRLLTERSSLDMNTAESQAENARFSYLVSSCTVYNDKGKPYFTGYEEYLSRAEEPVAIAAANKLGFMLNGLEENFIDKLPENVWKKKQKEETETETSVT